MNILYIACSCSPYHGSEDKIGWSVPIQSAEKNRVFVITRESQRGYIEDYLAKNPTENIYFYYIDVPAYLYKLARGFAFTILLHAWNKRAMRLAEAICRKENIEIIHQITPVEFRSIGDYWKIPNVKYVCGPIAGGQRTPKCFRPYLGKHRIKEDIRVFFNDLCRIKMQCNQQLSKCDTVLFANNETKDYLQKLLRKGQDGRVTPDVSVGINELCDDQVRAKRTKGKRIFLVAGRLIYLKGHSFLMDVLAQLPKEAEFECRIVGEGPEKLALEKKCRALGLDHKVTFVGQVPYAEMEREYMHADVLVFPSFREATGSVIPEAMAKAMPVVVMNKFGAATILNEETGWLYDGNTIEEAMQSLRNALLECIEKPDEVVKRGENARKRAELFTWEKRMANYQAIYEACR